MSLGYWILAAVAIAALLAYGWIAFGLWLEDREERIAAAYRPGKPCGRHSCDGDTQRLEIPSALAAIGGAK